jgi:hypothetical protein
MPVCPHRFLFLIFNAALFKEIAAEADSYIRKKISEAMPLKKHLVLVGWEDVNTAELMAFHGVMLNMARLVKCSIKDFFCEQWLDSLHDSTRTYFQGREFCNYIGITMSCLPPRAELHIAKCSPEPVK